MRHALILTTFLAACAGHAASRSAPAPAPKHIQTFGECLAEKVAVLYVASWCGHCHDQLEWLGDYALLIPVADCEPPGSENQTAECVGAHIEAYPTWRLRDNRRLEGAFPLTALAQALGCPAP